MENWESLYFAEADPEILKKGGTLCWAPCLAAGANFRFQVVERVENDVKNCKFLAKYFFQYFQIFSIFLYNESWLMKFYQFFKINKRFYKKREKTLIQQTMRKEKLRKVGLCFIIGYFIKPYKMIINNFFFNRSFCSQDFFNFTSSFTAQVLLFDIRMTQEISKGEVGNGK